MTPTSRDGRPASPPPRKSFLRQITPPLPSFLPRWPPRPDAKQARDTPEAVAVARDEQWSRGPAAAPLGKDAGNRNSRDRTSRDRNSRDRTSDSSSEESDAQSHSSIDSSPASSIASPVQGTKIPLVGIDDVTVDEKQITLRVLSRLRDLYELASGSVCLDDHYTPPPKDDLEGLGIQLSGLATEENSETVDVVKKIMGQNNVKRNNIVREIIETEESYIRGLQELVDIYIDNIVPPHAPAEDSRIVFRHVKILLNFHKNFFLPALVQVTDPRLYSGHPDPTGMTCDAVAAVFEENVDFMKMYFEYINNFDEAVRIVEKWQTREDGSASGARFLKARGLDERHSQLNLLGYLLLPVQRVPRYKLLLADLVASTNVPSTRLRAGYDKIECLAREINDRKAEMEGRKRLVELERTVVCPPGAVEEYEGRVSSTSKFVDPARRLVKEEFIHVIVRRKKVAGGLTWEKPLDQKCLAISCSDKLFLCTSTQDVPGQPSSLSLLAEIPLDNAIATRCWESPLEWRLMVFDTPSAPPSPGGTSHPIGGESWRFKCNKEDDLPDWLDAISKATKRTERC